MRPENIPPNPTAFAHMHYDTVVVGARCAGAFSALNLARGGQRVLLVDRDAPGKDTLSTHALMRLGVTLLDEAGVLPVIQRAGTPPVRRTVFEYGNVSVPVDISPRGRAEGLYAPRRHLLDSALVNAARAAGVDVVFQTSFQSVTRASDGRIIGVHLRLPDGEVEHVRCDMVVGADGRTSNVARDVGAQILRKGKHRTATLYTYVQAPDLDGYRFMYGHGEMAGLIATNDGLACAFTGVSPAALRATVGQDPYAAIKDVFARCGAAPDLLPQAPAEKIRRYTGAPGHMRQAWGPGWALVGDAGYFKDPATAHGITDALRDAKLLSDAVLMGGDKALADYQAARDELSIAFFDLTNRIAALDWSLEEVQGYHLDLHQLMRAEQDAVLGTVEKRAA